MNSVIFGVIVALTLVVNFIWAFIKRKGITFQIYSADPNKHKSGIIAISIAGTIVGGGMFIAVGQIGYEAGTAGYVLGFVYLVGLAIIGAFTRAIREKMDRNNHDSLLDLLGATYDRKVVYQFCIVNLAMYIFLLAGQFVALFLFTQYVNGLTGSTWLSWSLVGLAVAVIFFYPVVGGLRKDIRTDIIQIGLVLLASGIILFQMFKKGALGSMWPSLTKEHIFGTGYGIVFIIGAILFLTPSFIVRMDMWQRIRAAASDKASNRGFWIAGIIACFFYLFFTTIGMWAFSEKLPDARFATMELINQLFQNPWVLGLIFGAFFAAVLSSADTFINNTSLFLSRMVFPNKWVRRREENNDKFLLRYSRIFAIGFIVFSFLLAMAVPNFVDLLVGAFSLLLIYLPIVLGIFFESFSNRHAAFWSANFGVLIFAILFFSWDPKIAFVPAVILSIIIYVIIAAISRRRSSQQ